MEPIPGNTLWKRHDGPALFGEGGPAVQKLMEQVKEGGPGTFATVLGAGKQGDGHAVALVHDQDGTLRWADLTDRKVTPADGNLPENFGKDWTVWASVADPHENNISGPHDQNFMDAYSSFTRPEERPVPEQSHVEQPHVEQSRTDQPRTDQPHVEQPRPDDGFGTVTNSGQRQDETDIIQQHDSEAAASGDGPVKLKWNADENKWTRSEDGPADPNAFSKWMDEDFGTRKKTPVEVDVDRLSQPELHQFADMLIRSDYPQTATKVLERAHWLDEQARQGNGEVADPRKHLLATGDEIVGKGGQLRDRLELLTDHQRFEAEYPSPQERLQYARETVRQGQELDRLLKGHVTGAADHGGLYHLRNEYGPLSGLSETLFDAHPTGGGQRTPLALDPQKMDMVRNKLREFRRDQAYADVPTGTQWKTVQGEIRNGAGNERPPGSGTPRTDDPNAPRSEDPNAPKPEDANAPKPEDLKTLTPEDLANLPEDLATLPPEKRADFVRALSERNLGDLHAQVDPHLRADPELKGLYDSLQDLPYRLKHSTPAYHAIANSGMLSSQGDLKRRDFKFMASGKSSGTNTSSLGNDDFAFFRMEVGNERMVTRYGPTTMVFGPEILSHYDGWVSLHDQLEPLDRKAMQEFKLPNGEVVRTTEYANGATTTGQKSKWEHTYPGSGGTKQPTTFDREVFHGKDVVEGLALSVVQEVHRAGPALKEHAVKLNQELTAAKGELETARGTDGEADAQARVSRAEKDLGDLVSRLYRPEAKFGSGLPIDPRPGHEPSPNGEARPPFRPLLVHNADGDGRYRGDGTLDPLAFTAARMSDRVDDRQREGEKNYAKGETRSNLGDALRQYEPAVSAARKSVARTEEFVRQTEEEVRNLRQEPDPGPDHRNRLDAAEQRAEQARTMLEERRTKEREVTERTAALQQRKAELDEQHRQEQAAQEERQRAEREERQRKAEEKQQRRQEKAARRQGVVQAKGDENTASLSTGEHAPKASKGQQAEQYMGRFRSTDSDTLSVPLTGHDEASIRRSVLELHDLRTPEDAKDFGKHFATWIDGNRQGPLAGIEKQTLDGVIKNLVRPGSTGLDTPGPFRDAYFTALAKNLGRDVVLTHDGNELNRYPGTEEGGPGRELRLEQPNADTPPVTPPTGSSTSTPAHQGNDGTPGPSRGFGSAPRTTAPTGQQGTDHSGPSVHSTNQHDQVQHDPAQHDQVQQQTDHQDADQQQHVQDPAPGHEPLLPPVGTAEHGLVHDPVEFLSHTPVSVSFADGVMSRTPGLQQHDAFTFVDAFERSSEHWFTLERDPNVPAGRDAYVLTPAWEKYAEHDPSFPRPSNGVALPAPKPDHEYVRAGYIPYKQGRPASDAAIGSVDVVRHPDPARPGDGLVFTGGMNGCALAVTDVGPHSFKVWHVQSYSATSNLGPASDFRLRHPATDWFGVDEYVTPGQGELFEATNVLRHGPDGWEVISQEVVKTPGDHRIGRQSSRPLNLTPPTGAEFTGRTVGLYHPVATEQVQRFDGKAARLLREVPEGWMRNTVRNEIDGLHDRLAAQEQTLAGLRQPGTTPQQLRTAADTLQNNAVLNEQAANNSAIMLESALRMAFNEPANKPFSFKSHVEALVEEFQPGQNAAWIGGLHRETDAYLQSASAPAPATAHQSGFGSVPTPTTDHVPTTDHTPAPGGDTPRGHTPDPMQLDSPTVTTAPTPPVEHRTEPDPDPMVLDRDGDTAQDLPNPRKRGREDEENEQDPQNERSARDEQDGSTAERDAKRRRTPAYENTDGVMNDRGYRSFGPEHPLSQELVGYLGGEPKVHPAMSNSLLQKVNPHQEPVNAEAGFRRGNDLNACLENVEAYRDTHFGRPRVSGQTLHGTVEPIPGNTLWKRHDGPALFGEGGPAVQKLMEQVKEGGPGTFATVLGAGKQGDGHAVALVHDRDGTLRWADLTDRRVTTANGSMPEHFAQDWTVWASVADPRENNISGPHDPAFMERYSTFGGERPHGDDTADPMDIDGFGAPRPAGSEQTDTAVKTPEQQLPRENRPDGPEDDGSGPQPVKPVGGGPLDGNGGSHVGDPTTNGGSHPGNGTTTRPRAASAPPELRSQPGPVREQRPPSPETAQVKDGKSGKGDEETAKDATKDTSEVKTEVEPEAVVKPETEPEGTVKSEGEPKDAAKDTVKDAVKETAEDVIEPPAQKTEPPFEAAEFPPAGPLVKVSADGLCLLHSLAVGLPELAGNGSAARRLQAVVEEHFAALSPEHWPTEVVTNYRNDFVARGNATERQLLEYLPVADRGGYRGLPINELREIVGAHLTENAPPPFPHERQALLDTVRGWESRWRTNPGEMLPAAAAHALDLRLRVLDHDGATLAVFGPQDGRQVTVYRQGDHYDGSVPPSSPGDTPIPPVEKSTTTTTPAPEQQPKQEQQPAPEQQQEQKPASEQEPKQEQEQEQKPAPEQQQEQKSAPEQQQEQQKPPAPEGAKTTAVDGAPRPIAGTDLVVGLSENEAAVRDQVIAAIEHAVPGDRAAARAFAEAYFGPATLRPVLGALSRGEVWTAPFEGDGWSGSVTLRGRVTESTHLRTEKIEFENGADRTVATGGNRDSQWQYNVGLQAKQTAGITEPAELVGYFHDRGQAEVNMDLGGMVARSKTSEPADVFRSTMRLELDFGDLRHEDVPVRTASGGRTAQVDLGMTVAVPVRPAVDAGGEQRVPPQRLLDGRVGGQEIVLDLSPQGGGGRGGRRPVEALLDHVDQAGKQEFGKDWPAMREKVLNEVDFARLQRDLKSMTADEPVAVTLSDRRGRTLGTVEIRARVGELHQVGTTKETEFNIGTTVQQVRSTATTRGNASQLGLSNVLKPGAALATVGGAGRLGRDRVEITGDSRVSQLTSKSKVPGVLYDGSVHYELTFNGKGTAHDAGTADVRLLVDRADTKPAAENVKSDAVEPSSSKGESTKGESSKGESAKTEAAKTEATTTEAAKSEAETAPVLHEVTSPPDSVWRGGDRGGLGESVVVRDLESTAALRREVDAKGRERFGKDWDAVREQVLQGFSQPNLAARLTGMTRGEPLVVKVPGKEDLVVTATARVREMTYRREDGKAELNTVNESSAFSVERQLLARTVAGNGQLGGTVPKGTPGADLLATGSGQQRERAGGQGRQADRVYANGKYSAAQVIYGAELTVDVHFGRPGESLPGGRSETSAPVRVEVGLEAGDTVKVQVPRTEDGTVSFQRPKNPARTTAASARRRPSRTRRTPRRPASARRAS